MRIKKGYLFRGSPVYLRSCWSVVAPQRCHRFCKCNHYHSECSYSTQLRRCSLLVVCSPRVARGARNCTTCKVSCIRCKSLPAGANTRPKGGVMGVFVYTKTLLALTQKCSL